MSTNKFKKTYLNIGDAGEWIPGQAELVGRGNDVSGMVGHLNENKMN